MTADIELLPLPVRNYVDGDGLWETATGPYSAEETQAHARAVAEHNVKKRDAEIEALRAEVARLGADSRMQAHTMELEQARAERAEAEAEALRALLLEACDDGDEADADLLETLERARTAEAKAERLAEALREMLSRAPISYGGNEFHHTKDDRHGPFDACLPMQRWHAALDAAGAALRDHDQETKK